MPLLLTHPPPQTVKINIPLTHTVPPPPTLKKRKTITYLLPHQNIKSEDVLKQKNNKSKLIYSFDSLPKNYKTT